MLGTRWLVEPEFAVLRRREERTSPVLVSLRDDDLDHPQPVERQAVSDSQRLPSRFARDAGGFQECPDLMRVNLAVCDKYSSSLMVHVELLSMARVSYEPCDVIA